MPRDPRIGLTNKQRKWAEHYHQGHSQRQAAILAGYSEQAAQGSGHRNSKLDTVKAYLDWLKNDEEPDRSDKASGGKTKADYDRELAAVKLELDRLKLEQAKSAHDEGFGREEARQAWIEDVRYAVKLARKAPDTPAETIADRVEERVRDH